MALLGIDLGGTKLLSAIFTNNGEVLYKETIPLNNRKGAEVGALITGQVTRFLKSAEFQTDKIASIGIAVPGIYYSKTGSVWAPNIRGWENYPLLEEVKIISKSIPVTIDCDRACYIMGELWKGKAKGCRDAVFLAVGTGIGAGIILNGNLIRGAQNIAGAIGWTALNRPFESTYTNYGCFEYYASGEGIARAARDLLRKQQNYKGELINKEREKITSHDVFAAYENNDQVAIQVIRLCIEYWGIAVANLVSLLNPEKIIFGGGVFGPAASLVPAIKEEAAKWAQPIGMKEVSLEVSGLGGEAGVFGAGFLALQNLDFNPPQNV